MAGLLDEAVTRLQSEALSGLGPVELTSALRRLEMLSRRLDAGIRGLVAEIDRRGVAGEYGAASTLDLLRQLLLVSTQEASARVHQARDLAPRVALTGSCCRRCSRPWLRRWMAGRSAWLMPGS